MTPMIDMLGQIDELFRQQRDAWPLLGKGLDGLARAQTRSVRTARADILVRHIPHRVLSTTAAVDRESIRRRPCFLCPENLDPEQKGLPFGETHTIYCNPFPIVQRHLTVVRREHCPQRIDGQLGTMLDLARALPGFVAVYNGPECGASAPDHAHLQAGSHEELPLIRGVKEISGPALLIYGLRALLLRGDDRSRLVDEIARVLAILSSVTTKSPEPLINLAVFHERFLGWTMVVFPRAKHRPDVFHTGELTVSPAAIDLCGTLVTPMARDFERITGDAAEAIYREVTMPETLFREVVARLESGG